MFIYIYIYIYTHTLAPPFPRQAIAGTPQTRAAASARTTAALHVAPRETRPLRIALRSSSASARQLHLDARP